MKLIKRMLLLLIIAAISIELCGCQHTMQLNDRALVQAIGIDFTNNKIEVTLQIFSPVSGNQSGISEAAENGKIIQTTGSTIVEAMNNAVRTQGKELFVGHNRIIVFGRAMAQEGISSILKYFSSASSLRHNTKLMVAKGTAKKILTSKINQGMLAAEAIERLSNNTSENGLLRSVKLYEFLRDSQREHSASSLPMIEILDDDKAVPTAAGGGDGKEESLKAISNAIMRGTAVFKDNKMIGSLDNDESRGLLWLQGRVTKTEITIQNEEFPLAVVEVFKTKNKLAFEGDNENPKFILSVRCRASSGEIITATGDEATYNDIQKLPQYAEKIIREEVDKAFEKAIHGYKSDLFNFDSIIWKANPKLWQSIHSNFESILEKLTLEVNVEVKIERTGLELAS